MHVNRVVVVGPPGSGKTTVARNLARSLGCGHVELDALWWEPNWTEAGRERFSERAAEAAARDRWVIDGNYYSVGARETVWSRADTVVWLDQPRWVTVPRVVWRTMHRAVRRTTLWSGNRESVRLALRPDGSIAYALREHPKYNRRYEGLDGDPALGHLQWVRLRSPREVRQWLSTASASGVIQ